MANGVRQRLLDDPERGDVHTRRKRARRAFDDELDVDPGFADPLDELVEPCESRLWHALLSLVRAEHPRRAGPSPLEPRGPSARSSSSVSCGRAVARRDALRAGLNDDHPERVRDDVMELACDPCALLGDGELRPLLALELELTRALLKLGGEHVSRSDDATDDPEPGEDDGNEDEVVAGAVGPEVAPRR